MEKERFTGAKNGLRVLGAVSLLSLLADGEARAQSIWTHVASACVVDDRSATQYEITAARFKVKNGTTLPAIVVARCNVTNPQDSGLDPYWNYLEVAYRDPDGTATGSQAKASLYRVSNATGGISLLQAFDSNAFAANTDTKNGIWFFEPLDFSRYAYFVEIQVKRSSTASDPTVSIVRLFENLY